MEVVICMGICAMAGLGTIAAIVFSHQMMELDKQKLAALNFCRQTLEEAGAMSTVHTAGTVTLDPHFNNPGKDLNATITLGYYLFNNDGSVNWETGQVNSPPDDGTPVYCRVICQWTPVGSFRGRKNGNALEVRMGTIVRDDYRGL
jgi:hypothetical protein